MTDPTRRDLLTLANRHWFPSTTLISAARRPRLHIGCYPFAHDFENTSDSTWYNGNTIVRASSSYALLSGAHVLMPSVGYTFVLDLMMRTVAEARADTDYAACPILYHEIPAGELLDDGLHVMAAQTGMDVVEQIWKGYPDDAPGTAGELVAAREVSVDYLKSDKLVWSETGPGTAAAVSPVPITA
jgi:nitrilase